MPPQGEVPLTRARVSVPSRAPLGRGRPGEWRARSVKRRRSGTWALGALPRPWGRQRSPGCGGGPARPGGAAPRPPVCPVSSAAPPACVSRLPTVRRAGEDERAGGRSIHRTAESPTFPPLLQKLCKRLKLKERPRKTPAPSASGPLRRAAPRYTGIQRQLSQHPPTSRESVERLCMKYCREDHFSAVAAPSCPIFKYPESHSKGGRVSECTVIHLCAPAKRGSADSR